MTNDIGRRAWRMGRACRGMVVALCLLLLCTPAMASGTKAYGVKDVPNVRLRDARQYVSDPTAILSAPARDSIDAVLGRLEQSTGIETAVVMLPSIGEADIFDFAHELFRTWGIGKKKSDNGLLILFVMDQRKVRFTTGYGLEGSMTDAMARRIQTTAMVPRFKQADWDGGMVAGVRAAARVLDGSMKPEADDGDDDDIAQGAIFALLAIIGVTLLFIAIAGEQQRCPKCRKRGALRKVSSERVRLATHGGRPGRRVIRTTYICKHCGHVVTKDTPDDDGSTLANAALLGSMLGSGRRGGGFGGGGSFGGSFGGGSTGGGGATSGW